MSDWPAEYAENLRRGVGRYRDGEHRVQIMQNGEGYFVLCDVCVCNTFPTRRWWWEARLEAEHHLLAPDDLPPYRNPLMENCSGKSVIRGVGVLMCLFAECRKCGRGAEACQYCCTVGMSEDWEAICDCGLADFGHHLLNCKSRDNYFYVIADSHDAAQMWRKLRRRTRARIQLHEWWRSHRPKF